MPQGSPESGRRRSLTRSPAHFTASSRIRAASLLFRFTRTCPLAGPHPAPAKLEPLDRTSGFRAEKDRDAGEIKWPLVSRCVSVPPTAALALETHLCPGDPTATPPAALAQHVVSLATSHPLLPLAHCFLFTAKSTLLPSSCLSSGPRNVLLQAHWAPGCSRLAGPSHRKCL